MVIKIDLKKINLFFLNLLTFSIIVLPSGWLSVINIKLILIVLPLIYTVMEILKRKVFHDIKNFFIISIFYFLFLIYGILIGFYNGFKDTVFKEAYFYLAFYLIFFVYYISYKLKLLDIKSFLKWLFLSFNIFLLLKFLLYLVIYLNEYPSKIVDTILLFMSDFFKITPMLGCIKSQNIIRINFPSDLFLVFFMVFLDEIGKKINNKSVFLKMTYIFLGNFSIVISYSRYIWFIYLFLLLTKLLINYKNLYKMKFFIFSISIFLSFIFMFSNVKDRFNGDSTKNSDNIRIDQSVILLNNFLKSPFLGNGMGSYDKDFIRSNLLRFSYEMEILGFLMKFGILGTLTMLYFFNIYMRNLNSNSNYFILLCFILAVSYGFFNPYIIKTNFALLMLFFYFLNKDEKTKPRSFLVL